MRDYLFHGKRKDNGEWVEGYFIHYDDIKDNHKDDCDYIVGMNTGENFPLFDVIPETVGQFTGLTDKNGKKIFEGDVIQNKLFRFVIKYGAYIPSAYCKEIFKRFETIGFYAFDGEREYQLSNFTKTLEVIGNIHDNPEILKGGE